MFWWAEGGLYIAAGVAEPTALLMTSTDGITWVPVIELWSDWDWID